ncbi:MAG: hypothetical protein AAF497_07085, partial [Planctomycetota bacterium]
WDITLEMSSTLEGVFCRFRIWNLIGYYGIKDSKPVSIAVSVKQNLKIFFRVCARQIYGTAFKNTLRN